MVGGVDPAGVPRPSTSGARRWYVRVEHNALPPAADILGTINPRGFLVAEFGGSFQASSDERARLNLDTGSSGGSQGR